MYCRKNIAGKFGKAATDLIYKITPAGETFSVGYNFYSGQTGLKTTVTEISLAYEEAMNFRLQLSFFLDAEKKEKITDAYFFSITNGVFKTSTKGDSSIAYAHRGKEFGKVNPGEWINIAVVVPGYETTGSASDVMYVYVNGVKNEIKLSNPVYGTNHFRFAPLSGKSFYYDNVRNYTIESGEEYDESKDAQPVIDFGAFTSQDGVITLPENTTVAQFAKQITTDANVRVFTDNTYKTLITAAEPITDGAQLVFAANNKRANERTYAYYTVNIEETTTPEPDTYEEPDLYSGEQELSLSSLQPDCSITNNVPGIFGKSADDKVYRLDIAGSTSTGYNFIGAKGGVLDTVAFEFSFAPTSELAGMAVETSYYKTASTANNVTIDGAEVSNTIKGTMLIISGGKVSTGSIDAFASSSKNKVLYEGKPGEWINIALVNPGYNQTGAGTEKIYIYVNGIKHEILTSAPLYGTRHMRLSPSTKSTFYLDNIRTYAGAAEQYKPDKDLKPVYDETKVDALDGNVNVAKGTTVEQFKQLFEEDVIVRVFTNNNLTAILNDTDTMGAGNMVVLATKNKRTTERAYSYFTVNRPINVTKVAITNADGKIIRGTSSDISRIGETYYLSTTISNKAAISSANLKAIVAAYDSLGNMTYCDIKDVIAAPGTTTITSTENPVAFEKVVTPEGGTLKAFLWIPDTNEPLCDEFKAEFNGVEEYNILTIGNSYSNNSLIYLPAIAAADGVVIRAVNLYEGGCPIEFHYGFMTGTRSGGYDHVYQHTIEGSVSLGKDVKFEDGFNTPGYTWDFVTLHQKGQYSPFYKKYYTESKPYITEIAEYVRQNAPGSEFLFFESWAPYTDRITDPAVADVYASLIEGLERDEYIPKVFGEIKNCYLQAAAQVGNPNRVIPAGEAIYLATQKYGFTEYVDNSSTTDTSFKDEAGAMYLDTSSHLTTYGKILSALTWYEYLTGHDVTQNTYQHSKVSAEDMTLLKQIAHEACQMEEYNPKN